MIWRTLPSVVAGLVLCLLAAGGRAQDVVPPPWPTSVQEVRIPMRAGQHLAGDVHLPEKRGRYPTVVIQTPYDRRRHRGGGGSGIRGLYDREHYAYVVVDWRGFHGSRKARRSLRSSRGKDGYDVVEWAAAQPWSNGKVGTWGPSALGVVQWQTAVERPPHLVCAVPLVAAHGIRHGNYFEGGVLREEHIRSLDRLGFGVGRLKDVGRRPDASIYRATRRVERFERLDVPILMITGWYDLGLGRQLETWDQLLAEATPKARESARLLVGPWHHTALDQETQGDRAFPDAVGEMERETRAFLDHHLRGVEGSKWDERARVRVWRLNEPGWQAREAWPPPEVETKTVYLTASGGLAGAPPGEAEAERSFVDDPAAPVPTIGGANLPGRLKTGPRDQAPLLGREDVLVYTTEPAAALLRVAGRVRLTLTLTADRPDVDIAVRLCEVGADGKSMLVTDGIQRAQLRDPDKGPQPLEPSKSVEVTVTLPPLAWTLPKGSRLRLVVSGTNSPRFERNTHTGDLAWDADKAVPAKISIRHAAGGSRLELPLLP